MTGELRPDAPLDVIEPLVHGLVDGRRVSVLDARRVGESQTRFEMTETWSISGYAEGIHLPRRDVLLQSVHIYLGSLIEWVSPMPPRLVPTSDEDSMITISAPTGVLAYALIDDATVELVVDAQWSVSRRVELSQYVGFRVVPVGGTTVDELVPRYLLPLRDMVAFCTESYVEIQPSGIAFTDDEGRSQVGTFHAPFLEPGRARAAHAYEMLLRFKHLGDRFESFVQAWFGSRQMLRGVIVPLVVPTYAPYLFADVELLLSVLAIEGYHQAFLPQTVQDEEHTERVRRVVESVPDDLRDWVEGALADRTGKSASRKMREVMARAGGTGHALEATLPRFRRRALAARHRVAHPRDYESENGAEMYFIAQGLRWAVRHCLLLELGFDEAEATALVGDCRLFQNDVELLKRHALVT